MPQYLFPQLLPVGTLYGLRQFAAFPNANTLTGLGLVLTATGTATAYNNANTNRFTYTPAVEFLVTTAAATAVAGFRVNALFFARQAVTGVGGFALRIHWKTGTGQTVATHRAFVGVRGSTAAPTDVNPSTLTQIIGMGWDSGDANISIMHNDGTGTATKVDLGSNFPRPTADRANMYVLELYAPKTNEVFYRVTNVTTGAVAEGTLTTDLPTATQLLTILGYASVGGTSSVVGIGLSSVQLAQNL